MSRPSSVCPRAPEHALNWFQRVCLTEGVPLPVTEYRFAPPRRWRFDYAWPSPKVALEVEGGAFVAGGSRHTRGAGFTKDMEKYSEAAIMGWCVIRIAPSDLLTKGIDLVGRALTIRACPARTVVAKEQGYTHSAAPVPLKSGPSIGGAALRKRAPRNGIGRSVIQPRSARTPKEITNVTSHDLSSRR